MKDDFINQGLDAYNQFRRLGAGVAHTDGGFPIVEGGTIEQQADKLIKETRKSRPVPTWSSGPVSTKPNERPNIDPSLIFLEEPKEYLMRAEGKAFASRGDFGDANKNTT